MYVPFEYRKVSADLNETGSFEVPDTFTPSALAAAGLRSIFNAV